MLISSSTTSAKSEKKVLEGDISVLKGEMKHLANKVADIEKERGAIDNAVQDSNTISTHKSQFSTPRMQYPSWFKALHLKIR